jgi:hypothetical protein
VLKYESLFLPTRTGCSLGPLLSRSDFIFVRGSSYTCDAFLHPCSRPHTRSCPQ